MRGSGKKCKKTSIFGYLGQKGPFWTVFGQNGQNGENFPKKKTKTSLFPTPKTRLSTKKLANSNERIAKKYKKPQFFDILGQNGQFWTVFGQNGQNGNFFQKSVWNIFSRLQALTNCTVS